MARYLIGPFHCSTPWTPSGTGRWDKMSKPLRQAESRFAGAVGMATGSRPVGSICFEATTMALANAAAHLGWTKEETLQLLVARRRKAGS